MGEWVVVGMMNGCYYLPFSCMVYGEAVQWIDKSWYGIYSKRRSIKPAAPSQNATPNPPTTINPDLYYNIQVMGLPT